MAAIYTAAALYRCATIQRGDEYLCADRQTHKTEYIYNAAGLFRD